MIKLPVVLLFFLPLTNAAERNSTCRTPNGEKATCIPVESCEIIYNGIVDFNDTVIAFAKKSQCGYDTKPLVCCGTSNVAIFSKNPPESKLIPNRTVCGISKEVDRILGGQMTDIGEYPWMALLEYLGNDNVSVGFKCGGSLISKRYVLTAAHCVKMNPTSGMKLHMVRLGEWQISTENDCEESLIDEECSDPVVDLLIEEEIPHPDYNRRLGANDIALLRLNKNVEFTDYIKPICLPSYNTPQKEQGIKMVVAGWGYTENGASADILQKLTLPIVSQSTCQAKVKQRGIISENQLCAGGEGAKDSCQGDSGGPLMKTYDNIGSETIRQWYQEGIVSWGAACGHKDFPGVYTRVQSYLNWILDNMKEF